MYHQFKELADVDITAEAMEVGPTCHYVMGGIQVDPDSQAAVGVAGLFAAGEVGGGMHGSNRLGGNSLSDLLVFGRRAGAGAVAYIQGLAAGRPVVTDEDVDKAAKAAVTPFDGAESDSQENPYTVHHNLQQMMNDLVGIIRREGEVADAVARLEELKVRAAKVVVEGHRQFNPGWHLALDLRNMLVVSECVAKAALERTESRGGHTREDHPRMEPDWRKQLLVCMAEGNGIRLFHEDQVPMRQDLLDLFELDELHKYFTDGELTGHREGQG
jgi:succinate dehydrogenase / fumarate reductase flavoprotein subunit